MSGSSYNAVSWLLDRNVDEGRGAKLAFTDTVSELTYRDLQRQSCRVANLLRRLGVRREERVAMIMLDTVDFPVVFLGAIRAGIVPVRAFSYVRLDDWPLVRGADCEPRKAVAVACARSSRRWSVAISAPSEMIRPLSVLMSLVSAPSWARACDSLSRVDWIFELMLESVCPRE